jgi:hypothetical protein
MKIGKILKAVGTGLIKDIIPGAGLVLDTINAVLPDDKKLSEDASGIDATKAINSLPPEEQTKILSKKCDVEIVKEQEWTKVIQALSEADTAGASTRPFIALLMAWIVFVSIGMLDIAIVYAIVKSDTKMIDSVAKAWPLISALLGIPSLVLQYYFGKRTEEKKTRANAALGLPVQPAAGLLTAVKGMLK